MGEVLSASKHSTKNLQCDQSWRPYSADIEYRRIARAWGRLGFHRVVRHKLHSRGHCAHGEYERQQDGNETAEEHRRKVDTVGAEAIIGITEYRERGKPLTRGAGTFLVVSEVLVCTALRGLKFKQWWVAVERVNGYSRLSPQPNPS